MVKSENIIKAALVGIGAYLAYDYWQKKKANKVVSKELAVLTAQPTVNSIVVDAEMQEQGEEGLSIEKELDTPIMQTRPAFLRGTIAAGSWDSDEIS